MMKPVLRLFSVLALLVLLIGCSASALEKARDAAAEGDIDTALTEYAAALAEDVEAEDRAAILAERADLYIGQDNIDAAIADLDAAVAAVPANYNAFMTKATLLAERGEWQSVVSTLDEALMVQPDSAEALGLRGNAHLQLRNFEEAIADLKSSLQGDVAAASAELDSRSNLADAYYELGQALYSLAEYEEASANFTEALEYATDSDERATILAERGFIYSELGQEELALADLDMAISLDPNKAIAYAYRSYIYGDQGSFEAAISDAQQAVLLGDDLSTGTQSALYHALASAEIEVGEYESAIDNATRSIDLAGADDPSAARTYSVRARAYRVLAQYDASIADATRAIELGTTDIAALDSFYAQRARTYYDIGDYTAAQADQEAAMGLETPTAADFELLADIQFAQGDSASAISNYQQAIALDPENPWLHNYLGDIYYEIEEMGSAETEYRAAIRLDDQVALFHENLGYALRFQERYEEAVAAYTNALALASDRISSLYGRGTSYYWLLEDAAARADLEQALALDTAGNFTDAINQYLNELP